MHSCLNVSTRGGEGFEVWASCCRGSELKGSCLYPLPPFCLRLLVHVVYVDDDSDHSYDHADGVDGEKMTATMIVMVMTQNFHHCDGGGCRHVDGDCCGACAAEDTGDHVAAHVDEHFGRHLFCLFYARSCRAI